MSQPEDISAEVLKHPTIDCLQFLAKHDASPVGLHRGLGIPYRELYSILCQLDKLGLIGYKRFSRYNYFITSKGREILERISLQ
jgi:predicted transcriptional regulator